MAQIYFSICSIHSYHHTVVKYSIYYSSSTGSTLYTSYINLVSIQDSKQKATETKVSKNSCCCCCCGVIISINHSIISHNDDIQHQASIPTHPIDWHCHRNACRIWICRKFAELWSLKLNESTQFFSFSGCSLKKRELTLFILVRLIQYMLSCIGGIHNTNETHGSWLR